MSLEEVGTAGAAVDMLEPDVHNLFDAVESFW